jgi:26S proteasome regulatory subunit T5
MQARMIDNEVKMMRQENLRLAHERSQMVAKIEDNMTKIKQNKVLPYLVSKIVEVGCNATAAAEVRC